MDTLSSSVSTLKVLALHSTLRDFPQFKGTGTPCAPNQTPQPHLSSISKPNLISKTTSLSHKSPSPAVPCLRRIPSLTPSSDPSSAFHENPSSGYAAALIEVAQSCSALELVQKDFQRLFKLLKHVNFNSFLADPCVGQKEKGHALRQVVLKGNFHRLVLSLLKMLIKKNKVGTVQEVLEEFERIYGQMCGTQVVLVSSETKMEEDQLLGIARSVQKQSGAFKVKVRNLFNDIKSLPSYAV